MKYLILFLALLTTNVFANTVSKVESFTIAGRTLTNVTGLKSLYCATTTANAYTSFYQSGATSYQVPVGKKFRIIGLRMYEHSSSTVDGCRIGYDDVGTKDHQASNPDNPVLLGGSDGTGDQRGAFYSQRVDISPGGAEYYFGDDGDWTIPAEKWPLCNCGNATSQSAIFMYGFEEDE